MASRLRLTVREVRKIRETNHQPATSPVKPPKPPRRKRLLFGPGLPEVLPPLPDTIERIRLPIRILGPRDRKWDTSSVLRGNYKEIEDALVAIGWFPNDTPQWITETIPDQDDTQRDQGPAIVIEVRGAGSGKLLAVSG